MKAAAFICNECGRSKAKRNSELFNALNRLMVRALEILHGNEGNNHTSHGRQQNNGQEGQSYRQVKSKVVPVGNLLYYRRVNQGINQEAEPKGQRCHNGRYNTRAKALQIGHPVMKVLLEVADGQADANSQNYAIEKAELNAGGESQQAGKNKVRHHANGREQAVPDTVHFGGKAGKLDRLSGFHKKGRVE